MVTADELEKVRSDLTEWQVRFVMLASGIEGPHLMGRALAEAVGRQPHLIPRIRAKLRRKIAKVLNGR